MNESQIFNGENFLYTFTITSITLHNNMYLVEFELGNITIKDKIIFRRTINEVKHYHYVDENYISNLDPKYWKLTLTDQLTLGAQKWLQVGSFQLGSLHFYGDPSTNLPGAINRHIKGLYYRVEGIDFFDNESRDKDWIDSIIKEFTIERMIRNIS
jgi:hypothetical protein